MGTKIEWTDETWNPVVGCTKVSQGCKFCYAQTLHDMRHKAFVNGKALPKQYALGFEEVQFKPERLAQPLRWRKPRRVFVNSGGDTFHEAVSEDFLDSLFAVMALAPQHTFQVLTKRPERVREYLADSQRRREGIQKAARPFVAEFGTESRKMAYRLAEEADILHITQAWPLPNVWLGTSVENQSVAEARVVPLIQTEAAVKFLSCEPLLGPLNLEPWLSDLDWVITGGESGKRARPMHPDWVRDLRDACQREGTAFFHKQNGEWKALGEKPGEAPGLSEDDLEYIFEDGQHMGRLGRRRSGRILDGRTWEEFPNEGAR